MENENRGDDDRRQGDRRNNAGEKLPSGVERRDEDRRQRERRKTSN